MKQSARGITLIETLVASTLMVLFFTAVAVLLQLILQSIGEARVRLVATSLAQEKLEVAQNLPYLDVGTVGGIPPGSLTQQETIDVNGQDFFVSTSVIYIDDTFDGVAPIDPIPNDYKRVRVVVDWDGAFKPKSPLVLLTDISPAGIEFIEDAGTLLIQVYDALGVPVVNADVSIKADSVIPSIDLQTLSDVDGRVLLPGAPICFECYEITVTKSGFSTHRTYSSAEVANPSKPHLTILEGELTSASFSIDQLASMNVTVTRSRQASYAPFPGVNFNLRGDKIIGTNTLDEPVYLYDQNFTTGAFGRVTISGLEWDNYTFTLPGGSSVDIAGTNPLNPFSVSPGSSPQVSVVTDVNSLHSLLVAVEDSGGALLPDASISVLLGGVPVATKSAGAAGLGDQGQAFFGGLNPVSYDLLVSLDQYQIATGSVSVNGDITELVLLTGL